MDHSAAEESARPNTLVEMLHDGIYLLFLLKHKFEPLSLTAFTEKIDTFLAQFERNAKKINTTPEDISLAKYAFCAFIDESVLASNFAIRPDWEMKPLQLRYFGEHLAGENFFQKLETLRNQGASHLQVLEVFHYCLLLGFEGKYRLEDKDKLGYLVSRLGEEIDHHRGKPTAFAPHWRIPDEIKNIVRHEIPTWAWLLAFIAAGLLVYSLFDWLLGRNLNQTLAPFVDMIKPLPRNANVIITLP
jgi:type VI secretion system protein ImpK